MPHFQGFPLSHTAGYKYSFGGFCFVVSQHNLNFDVTSVSFVDFGVIIVVIFGCQPEMKKKIHPVQCARKFKKVQAKKKTREIK